MPAGRSLSGPALRLIPGEARASSPGLPLPALDDSELLAALRAGDPSAATALHDRMRPQIDRTIRRLFGCRDVDHEDVAQQALIELVTTIDRYRGDCSLDSWGSAIAAHVVYKHLRRRKIERRIFAALDPTVHPDPRSSSQTGRDALLRNGVKRVLSHLGGMDEAKVWTFVLHDVWGYDMREIAQITGVTASAAQTRLVRGRREVHDRVAGDPELAQLLESIGGGS